MLSIYKLKSAFQNLLRPITTLLAGKGVTANQVTISAVILSLITGLLIALWPTNRWILCCVPVVLILRMALNAIDGMLAREFNMKSPLGAVLNELGDIISDSALYLPFAWVNQSYAPLVVVIVILSIISEMAGVIGVQIGSERRYDGPMGKSDRAFVFGAMALLIGLGLSLGVWYLIALLITTALLVFTIFNRVKGAINNV